MANRAEELQGIINRCQTVIDSLSGNAGWMIALEDFESHRKMLDDSWQYSVNDEKRIKELGIAKLAALKIINLIDDYRKDMETALIEKAKIDHPDLILDKDVDNS